MTHQCIDLPHLMQVFFSSHKKVLVTTLSPEVKYLNIEKLHLITCSCSYPVTKNRACSSATVDYLTSLMQWPKAWSVCGTDFLSSRLSQHRRSDTDAVRVALLLHCQRIRLVLLAFLTYI